MYFSDFRPLVTKVQFVKLENNKFIIDNILKINEINLKIVESNTINIIIV